MQQTGSPMQLMYATGLTTGSPLGLLMGFISVMIFYCACLLIILCSAGPRRGVYISFWARRPLTVLLRHHADDHEPECTCAVPSDQLPLPLLR